MPDNRGWQNFRDEELPPNANAALRQALADLDAASRQTRSALNLHYLFLKMKRTQAFADAVSNTSVAFGANIVAGALLTAIFSPGADDSAELAAAEGRFG